MNGQMLFATEITCIIFLIIFPLTNFLRRGEKSASVYVLINVMVMLIICNVADAISNITSHEVSGLLLSFTLPVSYCGGALTLILFYYYCYVYIKERMELNKWFFYVPMIIVLLDFIGVLILALTGHIYIIQGNQAIVTGGLPLFASIIPIAGVLYIPLVFVILRKKIALTSVFTLGFFGLLPLISSMLTMLTKGDDYTYPACSVAVVIVFILMENRDSYEKVNKLNEQLQQQQKEIQQRLDIIQSMNSVYFASFYIDLQNDTYIELSSKNNIREVVKSVGQAQSALNLACEKLMQPEFTEPMKHFFDLSNIQERMKDKKVLSQRYVGVTSGWSMAYLIAGDRDENGKLLHLFYACRTIHDEKAKEEEQKSKIEAYNEIIANAGLGIWNIMLFGNEKPRMQANAKMLELLGIKDDSLSDEEVYSWWYDRIVPEALPSVQNSVNEMLEHSFSENTYLWNHPEKGQIYVRCGGNSRIQKDGNYVLSGYHADVSDIVLQENLKRHAEELEINQQRMKELNVSLLGALGTVVEFRSLESGDHVKRVMNFTKILLKKLQENYPEYNLTDEQIDMISHAAALHDVGKIAIPDEILKAPRRLTVDEFDEMKKHTTYGCEILERFNFIEHNEFFKYCYEICRWHHEKADGKGYPDGLVEKDIPIYCQVTAVADCFDALVSKRVYKDAKKCEEAYEMIVNGECGVFSKSVLDCFEMAKEELFSTVEQV